MSNLIDNNYYSILRKIYTVCTFSFIAEIAEP